MTLALPKDLQYSLLEFIAHCSAQDFSQLAEDFVKLGASPPEQLEAVRQSGIPEGFAFIMRQFSEGGGPAELTNKLRREFKARYGQDLSDAQLSLKCREGMKHSEVGTAVELGTAAQDAIMSEHMLDSVSFHDTATTTTASSSSTTPAGVAGVTGVLEMMSKRNRAIFKLPSYMLYVARAFSTLEGIGLSIDPQYSILQECYPYLAKRLMTDNSPRSRKALRGMLCKEDGRISAQKLVEFSQGFSSYTASTSDSAGGVSSGGSVDTSGSGSSSGGGGGRRRVSRSNGVQRAFADLLLNREGNLMQELLLDSAAQFSDSLLREGFSAAKHSRVGQLTKAALTAPKQLVDLLVPESLKPLALPLTLPYDFTKAVASIAKAQVEDRENVESLKLLWQNLQPLVRSQLKETVESTLHRSGIDNHRASETNAGGGNAPNDGNSNDNANLQSMDLLNEILAVPFMVQRRLPSILRLSRQMGVSLLTHTADRMQEHHTKTKASAESESSATSNVESGNVDKEVVLLLTEGMSSLTAIAAKTAAKILSWGPGFDTKSP